MEFLSAAYWNQRYQENNTGWDIGYANPAILNYFKENEVDLNISILIPGCGSSYEGEELYRQGYKNVTLLDFAEEIKESFLKRVPEFPENQFLVGDFFKVVFPSKFDFIIEQTFLCAINPDNRNKYVNRMSNLLNENKGKLIGVLFNRTFEHEGPPYGGNINDYNSQFSKHFSAVSFSENTHGIPQRKENEVWFEASV